MLCGLTFQFVCGNHNQALRTVRYRIRRHLVWCLPPAFDCQSNNSPLWLYFSIFRINRFLQIELYLVTIVRRRCQILHRLFLSITIRDYSGRWQCAQKADRSFRKLKSFLILSDVDDTRWQNKRRKSAIYSSAWRFICHHTHRRLCARRLRALTTPRSAFPGLLGSMRIIIL